jgi:poly(A) polymerase
VRGAALTQTVLERLKFPNRTITEVAALVAQHMRFMEVPHMRESKLKRFLRQDFFDDHLQLHYLDCMASHRDLTSYDHCTAKLAEFGREEVLKPPLLVNGHDLIALGYTPGPLFREVLEYIEDMQLEGAFHSKEEALAAVRAAFPAGRGPGPAGAAKIPLDK